MAAISASKLSPYVKILDVLNEEAESAQFHLKHQLSYQDFDWSIPLLDLFRQASYKGGLTVDEKKQWVFSMHKQVINIAYDDPLENQIATACGRSLVEIICNTIERKGSFVNDNMLYYRYFVVKDNFDVDYDKFTEILTTNMSASLKENNLIPAFEVIYWMRAYYFHTETNDHLAQLALDKFFPDSTAEKAIYIKLIPGIFKAIKDASNSYIHLTPYKKTGPNECCPCVIL